jgi:homoserine dehydrogenase
MMVDLALVGHGNVAQRFVRLIEEKRANLEHEHDITCRVAGIATKRHGSFVAGADGARIPVDGSRAVIDHLGRSDAPVRVVIETTTLDISAGQPAIDHVLHALGAGCHVVTANKGPAAFAYHALADAARRRNLSFLFEGAVMDGVPVFNLVRETMPAVTIVGFRGVVNSTTNHILTALEDGDDFMSALAHMQAEGIAEADPSLDVDGWDAAAKTAALANVLLNARITPHDVDRRGIGVESAALARAARDRGCRLRLVASAQRGGRASVRLEELPQEDVLAGLRGVANGLVLETDLLGSVAITQMDGGLTQTAYALLSDLIAVRRRCRH